MSFNALYDTAGSALNAQTIRLNTVSSNLANADSVASNPNDVYKALKPVFSSVYNQFQSQQLENPTSVPVYIADVVEVESLVEGRYEPNNPLANEDGYIYHSGINVVNEMADMMSATRSFEASAEVLSNVKSMQQSLLRLMEA
ncbi:flagellar basal body rod protein FlgC [Vibrio sp. B1FLJ16]|uniref:flagellar basal body rod protein FlgC n=1 Tax=Vibrio sp. B1FLJ16 TaxID=2751178 RepID=UPI0015F6E2DA|nr:flagellar basal body rod protein FlgC [Vibrio sp. B1FLJ16]MCA0934927.1 flagellar basal body rod protein FlgC [Vibrio alginolyticus]CAD7812019.1 Belongs to the flagella basal body rod proteins family [Vibrio sp. B1FLJ16]CAE6917788.1 Belongs to the flagella basal body rod proteins family [Vibrio sp. B1FLJ16]